MNERKNARTIKLNHSAHNADNNKYNNNILPYKQIGMLDTFKKYCHSTMEEIYEASLLPVPKGP